MEGGDCKLYACHDLSEKKLQKQDIFEAVIEFTTHLFERVSVSGGMPVNMPHLERSQTIQFIQRSSLCQAVNEVIEDLFLKASVAARVKIALDSPPTENSIIIENENISTVFKICSATNMDVDIDEDHSTIPDKDHPTSAANIPTASYQQANYVTGKSSLDSKDCLDIMVETELQDEVMMESLMEGRISDQKDHLLQDEVPNLEMEVYLVDMETECNEVMIDSFMKEGPPLLPDEVSHDPPCTTSQGEGYGSVQRIPLEEQDAIGCTQVIDKIDEFESPPYKKPKYDITNMTENSTKNSVTDCEKEWQQLRADFFGFCENGPLLVHDKTLSEMSPLKESEVPVASYQDYLKIFQIENLSDSTEKDCIFDVRCQGSLTQANTSDEKFSIAERVTLPSHPELNDHCPDDKDDAIASESKQDNGNTKQGEGKDENHELVFLDENLKDDRNVLEQELGDDNDEFCLSFDEAGSNGNQDENKKKGVQDRVLQTISKEEGFSKASTVANAPEEEIMKVDGIQEQSLSTDASQLQQKVAEDDLMSSCQGKNLCDNMSPLFDQTVPSLLDGEDSFCRDGILGLFAEDEVSEVKESARSNLTLERIKIHQQVIEAPLQVPDRDEEKCQTAISSTDNQLVPQSSAPVFQWRHKISFESQLPQVTNLSPVAVSFPEPTTEWRISAVPPCSRKRRVGLSRKQRVSHLHQPSNRRPWQRMREDVPEEPEE